MIPKTTKNPTSNCQNRASSGPGPPYCAKRFQSARRLLAGELGRATSTTQFVLYFDPLKSPSNSAQSAFSCVLSTLLHAFFHSFSELGKSQTGYIVCPKEPAQNENRRCCQSIFHTTKNNAFPDAAFLVFEHPQDAPNLANDAKTLYGL